jgi:uncharacterized protein YcbX
MTASKGALASLHRYPVKSMMGEALRAAQITEGGLFGDRAYALCDAETGKVVSAKNSRKWPNLFSYHAGYTVPPEAGSAVPPVRVKFPDGGTAVSSSPNFAAALSAALGRSVTLLTSPPQHAQLEEYWPDMEELAQRDVVTDEAMPQGIFFDCASIHLLSTATLNRLQQLSPRSRFEIPRFRPNLVIDTGDRKGFVENDWIDKVVAIGPEVRIRVTRPCFRCVMTTLAQGDLPSDHEILRTAVKHNQKSVGAYASVVRTGTIRVGDTITVL